MSTTYTTPAPNTAPEPQVIGWYAAVAGLADFRAYPSTDWEFARIAGMTPVVAVAWVTSVPADAELLDAVR